LSEFLKNAKKTLWGLFIFFNFFNQNRTDSYRSLVKYSAYLLIFAAVFRSPGHNFRARFGAGDEMQSPALILMCKNAPDLLTE